MFYSSIIINDCITKHSIRQYCLPFAYIIIQTSVLIYKKETIHHLKPNSIDNMDHMHMSGSKPYPVTLSQAKKFNELNSDAPKCQNKLKQIGVVQ